MSICATCQHEEDKHYGGPHKWCNRAGCECQAFLESVSVPIEKEPPVEPKRRGRPAKKGKR